MTHSIRSTSRRTAITCLFLGIGQCAFAASDDDPADEAVERASTPAVAPDLRDDEVPLKLQRGDFVIVPVPISNPTLDTGLVAAGAYFYSQTEEQKAKQPASVTGAGAIYTSNDSKALVVGHQSYCGGDRWRLGGAPGRPPDPRRLRS